MQANPYQAMSFNQQPIYNPQQYGYVPYFQQQRMQQQQDAMAQMNAFQQQMPRGINGKVVQSVEMITANDVPMDGSAAFFPMQDMSAILAKSWNADGTIRTIVYEPRQGQNQPKGNLPESENLKLGLSDEVTAALMQRFDELSERLCQIEQSIPKATTKQMQPKKKEESQ